MNAPAKVALALSLALMATAGQAAAQDKPQDATVSQVDGTAMSSSNGGEYTTLKQGATVNLGDSISVSTGGQVLLSVTDGVLRWRVMVPAGTTTVTTDMLMVGKYGRLALRRGKNVTATVAAVVGAAGIAALGVENIGDNIGPIDPSASN